MLYIDADIGVVYPKRKIEEFIDSKFDITFYDRFYDQEIAAGAYIAKNTEWTKKFLNDYEDLFVFIACIRTMLGTVTDFGHIRVMKKGEGWVRDNWITNDLWNETRDFMIHGWKNKQLIKYSDTDLPIS
ncbi:hypothetical protein WR25_23602 [Diploscapter pachys]|uniref:Nucleotide-diphospho-sugar transferase domain-containing protein n=1 Tax=Diploscapter pachys TaxID=2018661 RepID=A0A2A2L2Z0_9BILA|nr:hypothetical protein WR25_23602 [Diploscapter pachys]